MIILNLVVHQISRKETPCVNTVVKIDPSCPDNLTKTLISLIKTLASLIRGEVAKKKPLYQYSEGDITILETGDGIDILPLLHDLISVCGDFLISTECKKIIVVIDPPLVDSESEEEIKNIKKKDSLDLGESDNVLNKKRKNEANTDESPTKKSAITENPDSDKQIFVKGLSIGTTEDRVREYFAQCGEMTDCRLSLKPDGRCNGIAIMSFATKEASEACIALNGADFDGRWLQINYDKGLIRVNKKPEGCHIVWVGNISFDIGEETLRQAFIECGEIVNIEFKEDKANRGFLGFGHIDFAKSESTELAVKMAGTEISGRPVRVYYARSRKKKV